MSELEEKMYKAIYYAATPRESVKKAAKIAEEYASIVSHRALEEAANSAELEWGQPGTLWVPKQSILKLKEKY